MIDIEELKDQLSKGTFYYYKFGMHIKSKVTLVLLNKDEETLYIHFNGGWIEADIESIKEIRRPGNIIATFKWCYILKNEYDDCIGYIGECKG